jgi:hypothetical protein
MQTNIESLDYEIDMPIPPHIHRHTQQHLYTHGRPSRRADLAMVVERVLILPSTTLPSQPRGDIYTHPGSFLGKNPPPSVGFELTSIGTATSEYFLRQPCGHRATYF